MTPPIGCFVPGTSHLAILAASLPNHRKPSSPASSVSFLCLNLTSKRTDRKFILLTEHQTVILHQLIYAKYPSIEHTLEQSTSHISLLIRVQFNFLRIVGGYSRENPIFTYVLNLVLLDGQQEQWYKASSYHISRQDITPILRNHSHFYSVLEPPTDLYLKSERLSLLNLAGYYSRKEACEAYAKGPFHLIREQRYRPRVIQSNLHRKFYLWESTR